MCNLFGLERRRIEKRIIELNATLADEARRAMLLAVGDTSEFAKHNLEAHNRPLIEEKNQLEQKRQFLLDRRDDFVAKFAWNFLTPILVSVATTLLVQRILSVW